MVPPRFLIATTTWWPITARLAAALTDLGAVVTVIGPPGNAARSLGDRLPTFHYSPVTPIRALSRALSVSKCDLVIPCDERVVAHMHEIHARDPAHRQVIERSIGAASGYQVTESRVALLALADREGLAVPETHPVSGPASLEAAVRTLGFPCIVKTDGTWGGTGVRRADNMTDARKCLVTFGRAVRTARNLKQLLINRNPYPLLTSIYGEVPRISVQRFVDGEPANILALAWRGRLLACNCFGVLCTQAPFGRSTVARIIEQPEMVRAAEIIADRLNLSGYFGLDFVIERSSGTCYLIEMNPRVTPLGHMRLGSGHDLPGALICAVTGSPVPDVDQTDGKQILVLYPGTSASGVDPNLLAAAYHDIPAQRPELVRELARIPYPQRAIPARVVVFLVRFARGGGEAKGAS